MIDRINPSDIGTRKAIFVPTTYNTRHLGKYIYVYTELSSADKIREKFLDIILDIGIGFAAYIFIVYFLIFLNLIT